MDRCRRAGRSWSEISTALGVTKQAVHKRFAGPIADRLISATPAPSFERFTDRARAALGAAEVAARDLHRDRVGSEHLLIGLFAATQGLAARALGAMHIGRDEVLAALASQPRPRRRDSRTPLPRPGTRPRPAGSRSPRTRPRRSATPWPWPLSSGTTTSAPSTSCSAC